MFLRAMAIYFMCLSFLMGASAGGDGILAIFNGEAITYYDVLSSNRLNEIYLSRQFSGKQLQEELLKSRKKAVTRFIDQKILLNEFEEKGYRIPEFLIEERIDDLIVEQTGGDRVAFKKYLRDNDLDWDEYRGKLKERVAVSMMMSQFVYSTIKVKEEDIQRYIRENARALRRPGKSRLALLMLKKDGKYADKLQQTADDILALLKHDEPFEKLVSIYSEGPFVSKKGDLGWLEDSNIRKECRKEVAALAVGGHTGVIKFEEGHLALFKLLGREAPSDIWTDEEVRTKASRAVRRQKEDEKYEQYMKGLRAKNIIKELF